MRAIRRQSPGVAELVEVPEPDAGPGEVLVEVLYAGVNPFDVQVLRGQIGGSAPLTLGAEATGLLDGQLVQVSGAGIGAGRDGTYAERVVAPANAVRPLPEGIDPRLTATVGVAGKTAWRAVHQLAQVGSEDVVLVLGASGGVGTFAAQLARATGARVLAHTGDEDKATRLDRLALETVVAEGGTAVAAAVAELGVTVVLDPLGGDYLSSLLGVVAPAARFITYGVLAGATTEVNLATLYGKGLHILGTSGGTTPPEQGAEALNRALAAVHDGTVAVDVEVLPLEQAADGFARLQSRQVEGKLLLRPNPAREG